MDIIEQEKQRRCFYCEKLHAYLTATACRDNQLHADPNNGKRYCLNCEMGKKVKELIYKAKKWGWNPNKRIGTCTVCKQFTVIKDMNKWLCPTCAYRSTKNTKKKKQIKEEVIMENKERQTVTLDFTEYQELYEKLIKEAKEQFRTKEMQILYILNQFFQPAKENL
ncbi:hypothetical protein JCM12298_10870 [Desulfothermus naphthae]